MVLIVHSAKHEIEEVSLDFFSGGHYIFLPIQFLALLDVALKLILIDIFLIF